MPKSKPLDFGIYNIYAMFAKRTLTRIFALSMDYGKKNTQVDTNYAPGDCRGLRPRNDIKRDKETTT